MSDAYDLRIEDNELSFSDYSDDSSGATIDRSGEVPYGVGDSANSGDSGSVTLEFPSGRPNQTTINAIESARDGTDVQPFDSFDDLLDDIDS